MSMKLTPGAVAALELQRTRFIEQFGREPGPDDPVFFDPELDEPVALSPARALEMLDGLGFDIE